MKGLNSPFFIEFNSMATIQQMIDRLKALDVQKIAYEVLTENNHLDELEGVQRSQLWAGRDLKGELLKPSILDDPYFVEQAQRMNRIRKRNAKKSGKPVKEVTPHELAKRWADFKEKQTQHGDDPEFGVRPYGIANLIFTTGEIVWNEIRVFPHGANDFRLGAELGIQFEIEDKYGPTFGLNPQGVSYVRREFFDDKFFSKTRKHLLG
jgi:hypothetical protein